MSGSCYFCHGLVFPEEAEDILLAAHTGESGERHEVYLHRRCAVGHDVVENEDGAVETSDSDAEAAERTAVCPECGSVEPY